MSSGIIAGPFTTYHRFKCKNICFLLVSAYIFFLFHPVGGIELLCKSFILTIASFSFPCWEGQSFPVK